MNRFRAGYPTLLDDLAILRRERADTVCVLDKRSNRSLHHSSNFCTLLVNELPSFTVQTGCRGAIRTPVSGFKVQSPAARRPGITPSAELLSYTGHTKPLTHLRCGQASGDQHVHDQPIPDDRRRDHSKGPMQARSQSLRVQSFAYS
jgi:hypothetical protein